MSRVLKKLKNLVLVIATLARINLSSSRLNISREEIVWIKLI